MDMGIDANRGLPETLGQNQIRGLAADAFQRQERVHIVRHLASEFFQNIAANPMNPPGLGFIKSDGVNGFLDPLNRECEHPSRCHREGKQAFARRKRCLIFCAQAEDARNQNQKWIFPSLADQRHRSVRQMRQGLFQ